MADIFQEIDEDLRRDRAAKLWARYGKYVIAAAVLVVAATAAGVGYQNWRLQQYQARGLKYAETAGLVRDGDNAKAIAGFEAIAAEDKAGYGLLARIQAAALKAKSDDKEGGLAALSTIAADGAVDPVYRDLATALAGLYSVDEAKPEETIARMKPLVDGPWHFTALEVTALAQLKAGDKAAALKTYQGLADDLGAPASLRTRATEIVNGLKN
ncbi:MAG TPA: tetratricopeptide repeat protein [Aliidongia sp.]|uniref:tetratricopeptide repeat protein n=1 Tax=Aliidongia sp. TaxID=1914230 RepID=UPI002DDD8633|nr:tetratricopeptide repeat protein [Aliidongia sp.]HEV2678656.1 tetratricopeptide repeat protein [Aliidongia sp.]